MVMRDNKSWREFEDLKEGKMWYDVLQRQANGNCELKFMQLKKTSGY